MSENPEQATVEAAVQFENSNEISMSEGKPTDEANLESIFSDIGDFKSGELSRLCISRDFFTK